MVNTHSKTKSKKIAIIGGGILGLTTAFYLIRQNKEKDLEIEIFEKGSTAGGLAATNNLSKELEKKIFDKDVYVSSENNLNKPNPQYIKDVLSDNIDLWPDLERYYHHFFASDKTLKELLKDLNIADKLKWQEAKMGIFLNGKIYDFSTGVDILKFSPLNFFNRIRLGVVSLFLQKWPFENGFAKTSAINWCNRYFGKTITSLMWQPLLQAKFSNDFDKISMLWLRTRIKDRASSRPGFTQHERLGYIDGSIHTLITSLLENLEQAGVKINTNITILGRRSKNSVHELKYQYKDQQIKNDFDEIIVTIPPKDFVHIFDPPAKYANELSKIKFLGAICLTVILKKQLSPYYWLTINDPEQPFLAVVEHTNYIDKSHFNNKHIIYLGKYLDQKDAFFNLDETKMREIVEKFLLTINPEFKASWIEDIIINKSNTAQHIVDTNFKPTSPETGLKGLYYAHFSQIYPHDRGVNYAIASGFYLAKLISQTWTN